MAKRKTRSMTSDQQLNKCWQIVEEPIPAFNIDETQLPLLLDAAVNVGRHCSLVELEKLYSLLAQRVYHHRASYDRSLLLQVSLGTAPFWAFVSH